MALVQKAFSDIITFSRSSNATRVGQTGLVEYAPHNLIQRSQEFDNAYWTAVDASITANAIAAPDGTVTADKLIASAASSSGHRVAGPCGNPSATWTVSIYAKAGEYNRLLMATSNTGFIGFNLSTGAVEGSIGVFITHYGITPVGNGWYRCYFGSNSTSAGTNLGIYPFNTTFTGASTTFTGDGTSGIYIWGAQSSQGPYPLDYTPTTSAAVYGPRFDFDPVTLAARGLLVEEQRVNVYTYSEQFDNVAWTKGGSSITANAGTAPDGTVTADKIVEDSGTTAHVAYQTPTVSAVAYTLSVFAKAAERTQLALDFTGGSNNAIFNLSAGTVVSSTGSGLTAAIQDFGNGWYRCSITQTQSAGTIFPSIGPASGGNRIYTGNGTSGIFIWGAQLEAGSFATSYIPTVASTVTRSADVASVNTLSPWYNQTEGSIFAEASGPLSGTDRIIVEGGTASDFRDFSLNFANLNAQFTPRYATGTFDVTSPNLTANSTAKLAASYSATSADLAYNGLLATTKTSVTQRIPADRIFLGSRFNSSLVLNGHIRRLAYYPRRLTNAELQALTA